MKVNWNSTEMWSSAWELQLVRLEFIILKYCTIILFWNSSMLLLLLLFKFCYYAQILYYCSIKEFFHAIAIIPMQVFCYYAQITLIS